MQINCANCNNNKYSEYPILILGYEYKECEKKH